MVSPHSYASSRFQLGAKVGRLTQPLCSSRITGLHRSYGLVRPRTCHRYSQPHGFRHLHFSLKRIQALVPVVPHKSLDRVHAPYTPAAARPVTKYPAHSSQRF